MCDDVVVEMVDAGAAVESDEPSWMRKLGTIVDSKDDAFGCKATHEITHNHHCAFADELGKTMSQKVDGRVGGSKLLCEKVSVPKK